MNSVEPLDPRKQTILQAVVFEYVQAAEPVGSELLTRKYQLGVRSATVRNELAEMSELGYLDQPHTSAGRIPSDQGYRYFVDHIAILQEPKPESQQQVRHITREGEILQTLLTETTGLLSRMTQLLSAAVTVSDHRVRAKHAVITALGPEKALLVLILSNGHVENKLIECPPGLTLDHIGRANEILVQAMEGKSLPALRRLKAPNPTGILTLDKLLAGAMAALRSVARDLDNGKIFIDGKEFLFAQPEFVRDPEPVQTLFKKLGEAEPALKDSQEPVVIGSENSNEVLRRFSVVRQPFYIGNDEAGILAIIGPTRMDYQASLPLVQFTANAISQTLTKLFG